MAVTLTGFFKVNLSFLCSSFEGSSLFLVSFSFTVICLAMDLNYIYIWHIYYTWDFCDYWISGQISFLSLELFKILPFFFIFFLHIAMLLFSYTSLSGLPITWTLNLLTVSSISYTHLCFPLSTFVSLCYVLNGFFWSISS